MRTILNEATEIGLPSRIDYISSLIDGKTYMMRLRLPFLFLFQLPIVFVGAQQYWATTGSIPSALISVEVNCFCPDCIESEYINITQDFMQYGLSMTPNGNLYGISDNNDIFQINTSNGNPTLILDLPYSNNGSFLLMGIACVSNSICYSIDVSGSVDTLIEIDIANGTITSRGPLTGENLLADLGLFNGDLYYETDGFTNGKLARIILSDPIVNEVVMDLPDDDYFHPMTATSQCHTLLSKTSDPDQFVMINTLDGDLNLFTGNPWWHFGVTGMVEFETPGCVVSVDLDCNNSSGADGFDYQSSDYYCITENGVPVCDNDIIFLYDTLIGFVTIELSGSIPDGNLEYLVLDPSYPGLTITGSGTQTILIENTGNTASTVFKNAMRSIRYFNDAFILTLGTRVVRVNGQTYYNTDMNEAIAYIDVASYPAYEFDLGPDTILCDGNFLVLNTNVTNAEHEWSTNESTQMVTVTESGEYSVTVSGNEFCPYRDSIEVTFIPSVTVGLANNQIGCEGDEFNIIVEVDSEIPVTIEILSIPGDTIVLFDVTEDTEISLIINEPTYFEILSVTSSLPMCLVLDDSDMDFDILPTYMDTLTVSICEGDSFLIEPGEFVLQPGYYTILDNTQFGCDSIIIYDIQFSQSIDVYIESTTCIATDTGTFVQIIDHPSGCDTILETHVVLGPPDTTFVNGMTCRSGDEGIFTELLMSVDGCDSIVVRNIFLMAPQDTSWSYQTSCDLNSLGTFFLIHTNQEGCDSLDILAVSLDDGDTTNVAATSCHPMEMGVFETLLQGQDLCDSLIILTVTMGAVDTTQFFRTSCDSSFLGVHEILLTNSKGCDSLVIETVTYAEKDTTQLTAYTCLPGETGQFTSSFINQYGCDSIVILNVLLSPSHFQTLHSGSCFVTDTGTFIQNLINQFGCDSVITIVVEYYPSQNNLIIEETCHLADTGTFITHFQNHFGCDSIISHVVSYSPVDTTLVFGNTCNETEAGVFEDWFINQDGCDSLIMTTIEYEPAYISIQTLSNFNGYPLRCADSADGEIEVTVEGQAPFIIEWSTLSTESIITGLTMGSYTVTITDAIGCQSTASLQLQGPPPIELGFIVTDPSCFETHTGSITADPSGGVMPYQFSIDSSSFQSSPVFENLSEGMHQLMVIDENMCATSEALWINQPLPVEVELGDDINLVVGDSGILLAVVNIPIDLLNEITWYGVDTADCPGCLSHIVSPFITSSYSIHVTTDEGCADSDSVTFVVIPGTTFYIPSIFSPNDDGVNDIFSFNAGKEVARISSFIIFDRWGGIMFSVENRMPDDPLLFWDGRSKGKPCNSGVYVYQLVAVLSNLERIVRAGSVTLVR